VITYKNKHATSTRYIYLQTTNIITQYIYHNKCTVNVFVPHIGVIHKGHLHWGEGGLAKMQTKADKGEGLQCKRTSAFTEHVGQEGSVTTLACVLRISASICRPVHPRIATVFSLCCSTLPPFSSVSSPGSWH